MRKISKSLLVLVLTLSLIIPFTKDTNQFISSIINSKNTTTCELSLEDPPLLMCKDNVSINPLELSLEDPPLL